MNKKLAALAGAIALVGTVTGCYSPGSSTGATATTQRPTATRPYSATLTGTMTADLTTGAATSDFTEQSSLGAGTGGGSLQIAQTGASTYAYTGTSTFVAANGDKLFTNIVGQGTFTSTTAAHTTATDTITGGTGRFAGATGTYTDTTNLVVVSATGGSQIFHFTETQHGQIGY